MEVTCEDQKDKDGDGSQPEIPEKWGAFLE